MKKILDYLTLPKPLTAFELNYLRKLNRIGLVFFALHVPALATLAWANGTNVSLALLLSLVTLGGPAVACKTLQNPRAVSVVHGVAAMFFGALLVHFGQGPMQIEMHFYFFALIAMLAVFANPLVIVAAAVTVALHHLALWFIVPRSVFNYDAPVWVVAVHAAFVVLESVAACYIARSFFDNVIGLEKIVEERTLALKERNADLRLVFDNVGQGFVTVDRRGRLSPERSGTFVKWFGVADTLVDAFASRSPEFASRLQVAWDALIEGVLPYEMLLDQLPRTLTIEDVHYRVDYATIGEPEQAEHWLIVVTDRSAEVQHERLEIERRELFRLFERALADRVGVRDFLKESADLVDGITNPSDDLLLLKRRIHTLKGNSAIFGVESVAGMCHDLESHIAEVGSAPPPADLSRLSSRWAGLANGMTPIVGAPRYVIELGAEEHADLEREASRFSPDLSARIRRLKLEPTRPRLEHFGDQAARIAASLVKEVRIVVEDNDARVDPRAWAPFWSAFVHAVRNAVGHGLESVEERVAAGKTAHGTIALRTRCEREQFIVEIADDGRGIAWDRVKIEALAAGLATDTPLALQRALFRDGLSTATAVTDLSGRGIGLGALREATLALGGEIVVDSDSGVGTTVRMSFPLAAMAPRELGSPFASGAAAA